MTRDEVQAVARSLIGVPFLDRGRSKAGVDCIGVVCYIANAFKIPYRDVPGYTSWPAHDRRILTLFDQYLVPLRMDAPWVGTIGVFAGSILPAHVGIVTWKHERLHLVHARTDKATVLEQPFAVNERSEGRIIARYAFPGLED